MTITVNEIPFDLFSTEKDIVSYRDFTGENSDNPTLVFKRALPKPTKDFVGMEKSETKLTLRNSAGELVGIFSLSTSIRADQLESVKTSGLSTMAAVAAHAATVALVKEQRLPYNG